MKTLYMHKLNKQNKSLESKEFSKQIKKSSSQSVSGEDKDRTSSHKSSKNYQPQVARSLCGGLMAEEKPLKT